MSGLDTLSSTLHSPTPLQQDMNIATPLWVTTLVQPDNFATD